MRDPFHCVNIQRMCGCEQTRRELSELSSAPLDHNKCGGITLDLLQRYLRPVQCYLQYSLWQKIGLSEEELKNIQSYLELYIAAKRADPETCQYKEQLPATQNIVNRIISHGICL